MTNSTKISKQLEIAPAPGRFLSVNTLSAIKLPRRRSLGPPIKSGIK